jgi:hypothetical protein
MKLLAFLTCAVAAAGQDAAVEPTTTMSTGDKGKPADSRTVALGIRIPSAHMQSSETLRGFGDEWGDAAINLMANMWSKSSAKRVPGYPLMMLHLNDNATFTNHPLGPVFRRIYYEQEHWINAVRTCSARARALNARERRRPMDTQLLSVCLLPLPVLALRTDA